MPKTYIELEDYKTEVGFNGMFAGERDKMDLIRKVADDFKKVVQACSEANQTIPCEVAEYFKTRYPAIDVISVEPEDRNRGFYDYAFEDLAFFEEGKKRAKKFLG